MHRKMKPGSVIAVDSPSNGLLCLAASCSRQLKKEDFLLMRRHELDTLPLIFLTVRTLGESGESHKPSSKKIQCQAEYRVLH